MMGQDNHAALPHRRRPQVTAVRLLWLALLVIVLVVVVTNLHEVRQIVSEFRTARPPFIAAAAVVEVLFVLNLTFFSVTTFWATGLRASVWRFVFIAQASYFVNLVSKTGGIGGIAFYIREAHRTDQPVARVSAAYIAAYVLGYAAFLVVLVAALILLYLQGSLTQAEIIASLVITAIIVVAGAVPVAAISSRRALEVIYRLTATPLNRLAEFLRRPPIVDMESARKSADELYDAITFVRRRPAKYLVPFMHALGVEALAAALLYLMAHAVHANITVVQALSAYAITLLFSLVAITPSGLGFVEVSLSVLLVSFGVEKNTAIAAALGYRAFEFWLPILLGAGSLPVLQRIQKTAETK
jgi:glycosyltransferase 2 family protein